MRTPGLLVLCLVLYAFVAPSPVAAQVTVNITPKNPTVRAGGSQQFTAYVFLTPNKAVTWYVNGLAGGNAMLGTISAEGVYFAPAMRPAAAIVITAISVAAPASGSSTTVTLLNPVPAIAAIAPAIVAPGPFSLTVDGIGFAP